MLWHAIDFWHLDCDDIKRYFENKELVQLKKPKTKKKEIMVEMKKRPRVLYPFNNLKMTKHSFTLSTAKNQTNKQNKKSLMGNSNFPK